jgi:hypothetical protein
VPENVAASCTKAPVAENVTANVPAPTLVTLADARLAVPWNKDDVNVPEDANCAASCVRLAVAE